MPKKPTTTKDAMIEGAFRLIRNRDRSLLRQETLLLSLVVQHSRSLVSVSQYGCVKRIQPIREQMLFTRNILAGKDLLESGCDISGLLKRTNLFKFLFQSGRFTDLSLGSDPGAGSSRSAFRCMC